jgi:hypothetical protein
MPYGASLPLGHIICRDENGIPHYIREFVWPWTAYHPHKMRSLLHFYYWRTKENKTVTMADITPDREARIRELQFIMALAIYFGHGWKETGFGALRGKLKSLYFIARFAEAKACSVRDVLEQPTLLDAFTRTITGHRAVLWITWLSFLGSLDAARLGFQIANPNQWQKLRQEAESARDNSRQHAPLPTRIYGALINNLRIELDDIEAHADRLLAAIVEARQLYPAAKAAYHKACADFGPDLVIRHGLALFLKQRTLDNGLKGLAAALNEAFLVCKLVIHVFSGMRSEEARTLPFHCMVTERAAHGRVHSLIAGITTKLEGSRRRRTKWVTTEDEGFRAIRLAQRLASAIYDGLGLTPSDSDQFKDATPLFPSAAHLPWLANRHQFHDGGQITHALLHLSRAKESLVDRLCPVIEGPDIAELEEIDPFRSWRDEPEFNIGSRWALKTHQLRRSLALYANASGLVRISSLRRQLQHLTREMSLYYGRGSTFCKNFLAEDPEGFRQHVAPEWQDGNEEAKMLAFTLDVLNSKEPMFGGAGNYFQRQRERGEVMTREEVAKQFKAGLLNYNEGPLGGCSKPGICTSRKGLNLIDVACATDNCKHLIGKHSRIIQVIRLKRASLAYIDPTSIDYAMETEEIDALEKVEARWRPASQENVHG